MSDRKQKIMAEADEELKAEEAIELADIEAEENKVLQLSTALRKLQQDETFKWLDSQIKAESKAITEKHFGRLVPEPGTMSMEKIVADKVDQASDGGKLFGLTFTEKMINDILMQAEGIIQIRRERNLDENDSKEEQ